MIGRRALLAGASSLASAGPARAAGVAMIYVSAWDCPPCHVWQREHWPAFRASPAFARIEWYKIDAPRIRAAYEDRYWQAPKDRDGVEIARDLRRFRDEAGLTRGVPRWVIVKDGVVVLNGKPASGTGFLSWTDDVLPALGRHLGTA